MKLLFEPQSVRIPLLFISSLSLFLVICPQALTQETEYFMPHLILNSPNSSLESDFGYRPFVFGNHVAVGPMSSNQGGIVYLFNAESGVFERLFENPDPSSDDCFGMSIVQVETEILAIASSREDMKGSNAGAVHLFNFKDASFRMTLYSPAPTDNGGFGAMMDANGQFILIGAFGDANGAGAAYLFNAIEGTLLQTFQNPSPDSGDMFGYWVAFAGDKVLVGARFDDTAGTNAGAAYLFDPTTGNLLHTFYSPHPNSEEGFGITVDGLPGKALIGAMDDKSLGFERAGAAFVFNTETGELLHTFYSPSAQIGGRFGSVCTSTSYFLIGAPNEIANGYEAGRAFLFDASSYELLQTFEDPGPSPGDNFGNRLDIGERYLVLGAKGNNSGSGSAYVYRLNNGLPTQPSVDVTPDEPAPDDDLFCSASGSADPEGATVTYSYTWYSDGVLIGYDGLHSVTGPSLSHVYTERDQVIECQVTPNDGTQDGPYGSDSVVIRDLPPTLPQVDVTPDNPYTLDDLICSASGSTDREGAEVTYSYAWYRDGVLIQSDGLHSVTGPSLSNVYTTRDQTIECRVTPNDGYQDGLPGSDSVVIQNTPPPAPIVSLLPEVPTPDDGLAVYLENPDPVDVDGDLVVPLFVWSQSTDGATWIVRPELSGRLTPVFVQGEPEISSLYTQIAEYWRVDVSYVDFKNETDFKAATTISSLSLLGNKDLSDTDTETTFILPDLDGDNQVGPSDMVLLESVWGETKSEVPSSLRPLFFEASDPADTYISLRELLGLGGLGWYWAVK